jgi:hypothetical protein
VGVDYFANCIFYQLNDVFNLFHSQTLGHYNLLICCHYCLLKVLPLLHIQSGSVLPGCNLLKPGQPEYTHQDPIFLTRVTRLNSPVPVSCNSVTAVSAGSQLIINVHFSSSKPALLSQTNIP